jgi:hypothetical protein
VTLKLPQVVTVCDYHDIEMLENLLLGLGLEIKVKEIETAHYSKDWEYYAALVYKDTLPSKEEIKKLIAKACANL